jgi:hypothetical protein
VTVAAWVGGGGDGEDCERTITDMVEVVVDRSAATQARQVAQGVRR